MGMGGLRSGISDLWIYLVLDRRSGLGIFFCWFGFFCRFCSILLYSSLAVLPFGVLYNCDLIAANYFALPFFLFSFLFFFLTYISSCQPKRASE